MRIAALGRTQMLWNTINVLHRADHEVCLIATCRAAPEYDIRENDLEQLARDIGAEFLLTQNLNTPKAIDRLRQIQADLAVSVNWINIIGADACASFRNGILNAHAGDLPRYRGNAPVAWAILQGEDRIGITIHQMDPYELDAGPILLKDYYPLSAHTYIGEVFDFLNKRVPYLFLQSIEGLESGTLMPTPQPTDPNLALRCYPRLPEDGRIDWNRSADELTRLVRATSEPFRGAYTYFRGSRFTVWRAHARSWPCPSLAVPGQVVLCDMESGEVAIATGKDVLILEQVEISDQGRCCPALIIKSLRDRLGSSIGLQG